MLELLAVLALVAVLSGIFIGVGRRAAERGRVARAKAELAAIAAALEDYKRAQGDYPRTDDGRLLLLALLGRKTPTGSDMAGRALLETARLTIERDELVDPWGRAYAYAFKTPAGGWTNSGFVLYSRGPDGSENGSLLSGGFPDVASPANADNIHANRN